MQIDEKERGFSFMKEGPLDMRMDPSSDLTAREIINRWSEVDLAKLFRDYEERRWKQAARAIVRARRKKEIETTSELAEILSESIGRTRKKLHPATLVFQALRITVNQELASSEEGVREAVNLLKPGGRIGVLSFHRLEDRIVKNIFRSLSKPLREMRAPLLKLLSKKPLIPSLQECRENRRARSAKLRLAEKV